MLFLCWPRASRSPPWAIPISPSPSQDSQASATSWSRPPISPHPRPGKPPQWSSAQTQTFCRPPTRPPLIPRGSTASARSKYIVGDGNETLIVFDRLGRAGDQSRCGGGSKKWQGLDKFREATGGYLRYPEGREEHRALEFYALS